ncbi:NB-ARC domain-containing protein, partial [Streptomyces sp. IB201691-2A2]|uniref:NB-ARC domain-containing protein n=1 Tax=Streptomyces sp. IB201691-2A2 TaxID=2561920 RepID=UPI00119365F6
MIHGNPQVNYQAAPRAPVAWPHLIGAIPTPAAAFQHRAVIAHMEEALKNTGTAILGQVLSGMGGVGKTQIAAHYARRVLQTGKVDLVLWITADTRSAIVSCYAQAGTDVSGTDLSDAEQGAQAFLAWLEAKAPSAQSGSRPVRWLIVLDDVVDPSDLHRLWPPPSPHGQVLVTTRRRDAALSGFGRQRVDVSLFTQAEAISLLTARLLADGVHEAPDELRALAAELGHLPLALSQAAAYLLDSGIDCATYRRMLADRAIALADITPEPGSPLPDDQTHTVTAAWSLSVDRANELRPRGLARPMLELAAMLDAHGIPESVLTAPSVLAYLAGCRETPDVAVTVHDATTALRALHRLSLMDSSSATAYRAVLVHQLLQRTVRDRLKPDVLNHLARTAADALRDAWPDIERDTDFAQALRANANALSGNAEDALYTPGAHEVLFRCGQSLGTWGQAVAAATHFQRLADRAESQLGREHDETLSFRLLLLHWRGMAGDAAGAAAAFSELVEDCVRKGGPDDTDTFLVRAALARWRGEAGDIEGAIATSAELLEDCLRVQGPDSLKTTLVAQSNLAYWRGMAGDAAGAAAAYVKLQEGLQ